MSASRTLLGVSRQLVLARPPLSSNQFVYRLSLPQVRCQDACFSSLSYRQRNELQCDIRGSIVTNPFENKLQKRYKKTKSRGSKREEDSDDEDDGDDAGEENPLLVDDPFDGSADGSERVEITISSLRLDAFAKVAFGATRTKIDEIFYKGDIYINGERAGKKSADLAEGDEVDMVKHVNQEDHNMVDIKRAQLLKLPDKTSEHGRIKVKILKWNNLTVKAYDK